ncbi:alpha/beta fold hydrolase [Nocardia panacis]|uniref:Alpha/beta fold hydrolase n=1 Tax=Nocardia panacis TaxID=2340916 RepID=A0A3A4L9Z6_9NOCA|nr:alpha/beta fold hydrolase [Nocardia panacis]RJO80052.1 alpha/beta fold hydrolase [Nocardia panacis]
MAQLHVHRFGPADAPTILALHGLTGHGLRWAALAERLPEYRIIAPDLRGHGASTSLPPWDFETISADLLELVEAESTGPVLLLGHSFGGACALHLLRRRPDLAHRLILLDPAVALDPQMLTMIALASLAAPDYADRDAARRDKLATGWDDADPRLLEAELAQHLVPTDNGRVAWRTNLAATTAYWGQLARPFVVPPAELKTVLVQAMRSQPPMVTPEFRAALVTHQGANLTVLEWDCQHMVVQSHADEVAALVRGQ